MSPWQILGLAPTDDARAIRRAYATRLKALDPDDRAGFIDLRAALDAANDGWWAADEEEVPAELAVIAPAQEPTPYARAPDPLPIPPAPTWRDEAAAIEALVWAGPPAAPDQRREWDAALGARADRMLQSIDGVAAGQEAERWLAELIVDAMPHADALIGVGMGRFGWERQARQWDCDWAVKCAMQRWADVAWLQAQPPLSALGQGWAVLSDPARYPPRPNEEGLVTMMLREIDARHSTLRIDLDESAVAAWERFLAERRDRPYARFDRRVSAAMARVGQRLMWPLRRVHPKWPVTPFRVLWAIFIIVQVARCATL